MFSHILQSMTAVILLMTTTAIGKEKQLFGDIHDDMRSLSLKRKNEPSGAETHKCQREVPAIFFQLDRDIPVRGNGSSIYFHSIEVCCEGYMRSPYNAQRCIPECSAVSPDNCRNGFCRAPNQCECFEEFVRNEHGACVQTCPISCQHGRCYLDGTCECRPGYSLDPQTRKFCRPICNDGCGTHQECVAPGKCDCHDGYKLVDGMGCQPICIPDCGHGKCVGPNQCECFSGYMKRPQRNVCEAECYINCENGFCESRYKCQCRDGYIYDANTTSCLPDCKDYCQNGVCIAPGLCRCFEGYQLRDNLCEPICRGGCGYYGKCIETNICGCGFSPIRCKNGSCTPKGQCKCDVGLTRFVDRCVSPHSIVSLINMAEQLKFFNKNFIFEFNALIGHLFKFEA